jgi:hypothetical protein
MTFAGLKKRVQATRNTWALGEPMQDHTRLFCIVSVHEDLLDHGDPEVVARMVGKQAEEEAVRAVLKRARA